MASSVPTLRVTTSKNLDELKKELNSLLQKIHDQLVKQEADIATLKSNA